MSVYFKRFCSSVGLSSSFALLTLSSVTQVFVPSFYFWSSVTMKMDQGFIALLRLSERPLDGESRRREGRQWEERLFLQSTLLCATHAQTFGGGCCVCVSPIFCACVCSVYMKDWCWPKYLPICIRPITRWARERGGEGTEKGKGSERRSRCHR